MRCIDLSHSNVERICSFSVRGAAHPAVHLMSVILKRFIFIHYAQLTKFSGQTNLAGDFSLPCHLTRPSRISLCESENVLWGTIASFFAQLF